MANLKHKIREHCIEICESRIILAESEMRELSAALRAETKSSAGDKYETSRSMINLEKEKIAESLLELIKKKQALSHIDPDNTLRKVQQGSLVETKNGLFFVSTSLGKVIVGGNEIFVISPVSPIAQVMLDLKSGDSFEFNKIKNSIIDVS